MNQVATTAGATTREELGRCRAALRVSKGFRSITSLADAVGLSRGAVASAERGDDISLATLRALAGALGVSAAEYLGPDLDEEPSPSPAHACGGAS